MKTLVRITLLLSIITMSALAQSAGPTPFYYRGVNADGTPQTNPVVFQAYPPTANGFTIYGTNIVYGSSLFSYTPNSSGFFSNSLYANQYKVSIPALQANFFAAIPDTTTYGSLSLYMTNAPTVSGGGNGFSLVTNYLGYWPATNTSAGIKAALGYTPPTNSFASLTNALGYVPATNNPGTNTIIYVSAVSGITNASGYVTNLTVTLSTNTINYQIR